MTQKTLCMITSKPPYGSFSAKEALDTALIGAAFDFDVSIVFSGDGIYQLLNNQSPQALEQKTFSAAIPALELYGIEKLLVCKESLQDRGIEGKQLVGNPVSMNTQELAEHLNTRDIVLSF